MIILTRGGGGLTMKVKGKSAKRKKPIIEKQYERFFSFLNCGVPKLPELDDKTARKQQLQTWVTYGAFEDPII